MKNKLLMFGLATLSLFSLVSCGGSSEDYSNVREIDLNQIDDTVKTGLGLFYNPESSESQKLLSNNDGESIYKIYVASDIKDSLFVYNYDLKNIFDEYGSKTESININYVTGTGKLYDTEISGILSGIFDTNSGIKNVLGDLSFKDDVYSNLEFPVVVSLKEEYAKYEETQEAKKLSVVYALVYTVHVINGQDKLRDYFVAPIYHELTTDGNIAGLKNVDLGSYLQNGTNKFKEKVVEKAE